MARPMSSTQDEFDGFEVALLDAIFGSSACALAYLDPMLRVRRANERLASAIGVPKESLIGRTLREALPRLADELEPLLRGAVSSGTRVENREIRISAADEGGRAHWLVSANPVIAPAGGVVGLALVLIDVTERRETEIALARSEAQFRAMVEDSPHGVFFSDTEGRNLYSNRAMERLTGMSAAELAGNGWRDSIHPDDRAWAFVEFNAASQAQDAYHTTLRYLRPDGTVVWVSSHAAPVRVEGRFAGFVGLCQDITARVEMEGALRESEERYRQLFSRAPIPMWVKDRVTMRFLDVNQAAIDRYGYSREEFLAMTTLDIRPPEDVPGFLASRERLFNEDLWEYEGVHRHRTKSGAKIEVRIMARDLWMKGRRVRLVLSEDITERRKLEAQLLEAQKLEGVVRLAGGVAHDFNNLLTIILSGAAALRESLADRADLLFEVADIEAAGTRAVGVTRQLLTFARRQVAAPRPLDLDELVENLRNMLHRLLGEDVELEIRTGGVRSAVQADPGQIEQVIVNLAINARDAMPAGGKLILATGERSVDKAEKPSAGMPAGEYVTVTVTDTGVGMSPYVRSHLFEPFFTTKPPGTGTGLGLATSYGIMQQAGGSIAVTSEPGQGTTFILTFPALASPPKGPEPAEPEGAREGGETILLVEDESAVRLIAARVLRKHGYLVYDAGDPLEAIEVARQHGGRIDLLLTDVIMPKMGGRDLARALVAEIPTLRVLYTSGYTADAMGRQGELDPGVHFLPKPYVPSGLVKKVREVLDARPE
jgi:two-component system, cell cycle sensor histidine kinase and response regulator CckA